MHDLPSPPSKPIRHKQQGILPKGNGSYMGVVDKPRRCHSTLKWDGTPTDYGDIISRDCSLPQTVFISQHPAHELFQKAGSLAP